LINKFDVYVTKENKKFKAISPTFPNCEGKGDSEKEAIEDLGDDIAFYLDEKVHNIVDDIKKNKKSKLVSKEELRIRREKGQLSFTTEFINTPEIDGILGRLRKYTSLESSTSSLADSLINSLVNSDELDEDIPLPPTIGFNIPISLN